MYSPIYRVVTLILKMKSTFTLFIFFTCTILQAQDNVKLYTFYTPSHRVFLDEWFLPSLQDDYEIDIEFHEQICPDAQFLAEGWTQTTIKKIDLIIRAIQENWGYVFVYSDVDIQFFKPTKDVLLKLLDDLDIIFQRNSPSDTVCTGFFMCRANKRTLRFWHAVKKYMQEHTEKSDQRSTNTLLHAKGNPFEIAFGYLPVEFFCGGTLTGKAWHPNQELKTPDNIVLHHANWTPGIKNKIAQLEYVLQKITGYDTATTH